MAIPPQFNGSIPTWYSAVLSALGDSRNDLFFIQRHWSGLTAAQKAALKTEYQNAIATAVTALQEISTEIGTTV